MIKSFSNIFLFENCPKCTGQLKPTYYYDNSVYLSKDGPTGKDREYLIWNCSYCGYKSNIKMRCADYED